MKSNILINFINSVVFLQRVKKYQLWVPLVGGLLVGVIVLLSLGVPDALNVSVKARTAMASLDNIRQQLIELQKIELHSIGPGAPALIEKLNAAIADNQPILTELKQNAAYDAKLSNGIAKFLKTYQIWIDKKYLLHSDRIMDSSHFIEHASTGKLFLSSLTLLFECENYLHGQMVDGSNALKTIQWVLITLLAYTLITAFLYQYYLSLKFNMKEKQLNTTLESIADAVITTNLQGLVIGINSGGEALTNMNRDDAISKPLAFLFKSITMHEDEESTELAIKDDGVTHFVNDILLATANGREYKVINSGASICDEFGHIIGVIHTFRDVTREHNLHSKVIKQAKNLQQTISSSLDAVIVMDEKGTILEWNGRAEEVFGWSFDESITQSMHGLIIPEKYHDKHLQGVQMLVDAGVEPEEGRLLKTKGIHKEGHVFPIEISMTSIQHADGGWYFCAYIRDLSEIENTRQSMDDNKKSFNESQRIANIGNWEFDHVNSKLVWSDEVYHIFAFDQNQVPSYDVFMDCVHPEDRKRVEIAYADSLLSQKPYNIIHRIMLKDGTIKFVHEISETMFEGGKPMRTIGTIQEVTSRIIADDEMWQAATNIKTQAGIVITDSVGTIININTAYEVITGYTEAELIGKNCNILNSGKQDKSFYDSMWADIQKTGGWEGELWNKHKSGNLYAEWLTITEIKDERGGVSHYVAAVQDITDHKHAEAYVEHLSYFSELVAAG